MHHCLSLLDELLRFKRRCATRGHRAQGLLDLDATAGNRPVSHPFWPIECRRRHDIAFGIYNSAGHCRLIARCPRRQSSEAGVEMKSEERGTFWLEQIKGRARSRINLEQLKCISIEDKIGAVQTN